MGRAGPVTQDVKVLGAAVAAPHHCNTLPCQDPSGICLLATLPRCEWDVVVAWEEAGPQAGQWVRQEVREGLSRLGTTEPLDPYTALLAF